MYLEYIPTERQNADIFTKSLDRSTFETLRQVIGVILCPWSVLLSLSLCFITFPLWLLFFVSWFLCFSLLSLEVALHYIHAFHSKFFLHIYIYIYINKKIKKREERKEKGSTLLFLHYSLCFWKQGWSIYFHMTCLLYFVLVLMSLFIALH